MRTAVKSSIWDGLASITHGTSLAISKDRFESRTVRQGRVVPPKATQPQPERTEIYRAFIHQLENALYERAREAERIHAVADLPVALQDLVRQLHAAAISAIRSTLEKKKSGAPRTIRDARALLDQVEKIEPQLSAVLPDGHPLILELNECLHDLCADVRHYVRQIEITARSYDSSGQKLRINNRPTNWDAKEAFALEVLAHQKRHGTNAWPKPSHIRKSLLEHGHRCCIRAIGNWLREMKDGTAHHYVQSKKIGNNYRQ
jgi:hypothetical protein